MFNGIMETFSGLSSLKQGVDKAMKSIPKDEFIRLAEADDNYASLASRIHGSLSESLQKDTAVSGIAMAMQFNKKKIKKMVKSYRKK